MFLVRLLLGSSKSQATVELETCPPLPPSSISKSSSVVADSICNTPTTVPSASEQDQHSHKLLPLETPESSFHSITAMSHVVDDELELIASTNRATVLKNPVQHVAHHAQSDIVYDSVNSLKAAQVDRADSTTPTPKPVLASSWNSERMSNGEDVNVEDEDDDDTPTNSECERPLPISSLVSATRKRLGEPQTQSQKHATARSQLDNDIQDLDDVDRVSCTVPVHQSSSELDRSEVLGACATTKVIGTDSEDDAAEHLACSLLAAIKRGDHATVRRLFEDYSQDELSSIGLQTLLTYSHANRGVEAVIKSNADGRSPVRGRYTNSGVSGAASASTSLLQHPSSLAHFHPGFPPGATAAVAPTRSLSRSSSIHGTPSKIQATLPEFRFDGDIQQEASALLGRSVAPLSFLHVASILGEEEIAMEIVEYVYRHTGTHKRLLLMEFLGKIWGDANTCLHLASFQGQCELVRLLLYYGANPNKKNQRGYKPVDCAYDDETCALFRNITYVERIPSLAAREATISPTQLLSVETNLTKQQQPMAATTVTATTVAENAPPKKRRAVRFDNLSLLFDFARCGDIDALSALFKDDPSLDANTRHENSGITALHHATAYGHLAVTKLLVEQRNVDVNIRDKEGWTALHGLIAEIPLLGVEDDMTKSRQMKERRNRFLAVIRYMLTVSAVDLALVTDEGETVLDLVRENDETGDADEEVLRMLMSELQRRNVQLEGVEIPDAVQSTVATPPRDCGSGTVATPPRECGSGTVATPPRDYGSPISERSPFGSRLRTSTHELAVPTTNYVVVVNSFSPSNKAGSASGALRRAATTQAVNANVTPNVTTLTAPTLADGVFHMRE